MATSVLELARGPWFRVRNRNLDPLDFFVWGGGGFSGVPGAAQGEAAIKSSSSTTGTVVAPLLERDWNRGLCVDDSTTFYDRGLH